MEKAELPLDGNVPRQARAGDGLRRRIDGLDAGEVFLTLPCDRLDALRRDLVELFLLTPIIRRRLPGGLKLLAQFPEPVAEGLYLLPLRARDLPRAAACLTRARETPARP